MAAYNDYTPSIGTKFTIVYADFGATIKGSFATVVAEPDANGDTGIPKASRLDVLYYLDSIVMAVTSVLRQSGGQRRVAVQPAARDRQRARFGPAGSGGAHSSLMNVCDPVYGMSLAELPGALDRMSGAGYGGMTSAALDANIQFATALQGRFSALRNGAAAAQAGLPPSLAFSNDHRIEIADGRPAAMAYAAVPGTGSPTVAAGWTAWGQAIASTARVGAYANGPSWMSRGGGAVFGVDKTIDATLVVGAAGFYASNLTTTDGLRGTTKSYAAAAYGTYTRGAWELGGVLGGGWSKMTADRQLSMGMTDTTAHGSTNGAGVIASIEAGHRVSFATSVGAAFVKPIAGFGYTTLNRNAFTETGGGGFNLTVLSDRPSRAISTLGVVTGVTMHDRNGLTWWPELRLAWAHDFQEVSPIMQASLLGQAFQTEDANPGRDAAQVGLQLTAAKWSAFQVFGGYTGSVRSNATAHQGHLGLRARW